MSNITNGVAAFLLLTVVINIGISVLSGVDDGTQLNTDVYAAGSITFSGGQPADGDTVTIYNTVYEFDSNSDTSIGTIPVTIGATSTETASNLVTAINENNPGAIADI